MGLVSLIRSRVERRPALPAEVLRKGKPVKNPAVQTSRSESGDCVLTAPLEAQGRSLLAVLAKYVDQPATKTFELDEVGSMVWELCDGKSSFQTIAKKLRLRYKMNVLESEAALAGYLQTLNQRRLIAFLVKKDP
jgi:hypothetical protein